jgi:hypothetical protein
VQCSRILSQCLHCSTACWIQAYSFSSFAMQSWIAAISAAVLFAQSTVAFNCSIKPIYVDIHKRAVHDSHVFQYGSFIGVGTGETASATSAQNHSLWPSLMQNHMSFGTLDYCKNSNLMKCEESTGGFFTSNQSTRYVIHTPRLGSLLLIDHQFYRKSELQDTRRRRQQHP